MTGVTRDPSVSTDAMRWTPGDPPPPSLILLDLGPAPYVTAPATRRLRRVAVLATRLLARRLHRKARP